MDFMLASVLACIVATPFQLDLLLNMDNTSEPMLMTTAGQRIEAKPLLHCVAKTKETAELINALFADATAPAFDQNVVSEVAERSAWKRNLFAVDRLEKTETRKLITDFTSSTGAEHVKKLLCNAPSIEQRSTLKLIGLPDESLMHIACYGCACDHAVFMLASKPLSKLWFMAA